MLHFYGFTPVPHKSKLTVKRSEVRQVGFTHLSPNSEPSALGARVGSNLNKHEDHQPEEAVGKTPQAVNISPSTLPTVELPSFRGWLAKDPRAYDSSATRVGLSDHGH